MGSRDGEGLGDLPSPTAGQRHPRDAKGFLTWVHLSERHSSEVVRVETAAQRGLWASPLPGPVPPSSPNQPHSSELYRRQAQHLQTPECHLPVGHLYLSGKTLLFPQGSGTSLHEPSCRSLQPECELLDGESISSPLGSQPLKLVSNDERV